MAKSRFRPPSSSKGYGVPALAAARATERGSVLTTQAPAGDGNSPNISGGTPTPTPTPSAILTRDYLDDAGLNAPYYPTSTTPSALYVASVDKTLVGVTRWNGINSTREVSTYMVDSANVVTGPAVAMLDVSDVTGPLDTHGSGAYVYDPAVSKYYAFGGGHNDPMKCSYSSDPAVSWTAGPNSGSGSDFTYAKPFLVNGQIYVVMRDNAGASVKDGQLWKLNRDGAGVPTTFVIVSSIISLGTDSRFYSGDFVQIGNEVFFSLTRSNFNDDYRKNVYVFVLQFDGSGNFTAVRNLDSSQTTPLASCPVLLATMDASYRIVDQTTSARRGQIPGLVQGPNGNLNLAYLDYADADAALLTNAATIQHIELTLTGTIVSGPTAAASTPVFGLHNIAPTATGVEMLFSQVTATVPVTTSTPFGKGGDMMRATRADGGAWSAASLVRTAAKSAGLSRPTKVRGATATAAIRFVYAETAEADTTYSIGIGALRTFLYGAAGNVTVTVPEDAETTAYINRGIALGAAVPTNAWRVRYNSIITGLRRCGLSAVRDCGYLHVAHDRIQARVNLFGANWTGTEVGSATWTSTGGYAPDGTTFRFDTGLNPSVAVGINFALTTAAVDYMTVATIRNASPLIGVMPGGANPSFHHNPKTMSDNMSGRANDATALSTSVGTGAAPYTFHFRRTPSERRHIRNATSTAGADTQAVTAVPDSNFCAYGNATTYDSRSMVAVMWGKYKDGNDQYFMQSLLSRYGIDTGVVV